MSLVWKENKKINQNKTKVSISSETVIHSSECNGISDSDFQITINQCIDKATELLERNFNTDSMYLLFEWDLLSSILTIVLTDESKKNDSSDIVMCAFPKVADALNITQETSDQVRQSKVNGFSDDIQYWIRDYLTTCASFQNYSLIAVFHNDSRDHCRLL